MQTIDSFLDEWTTAEVNGDATALDRLLTDDFCGVGPLGFTLPKAAWLARHAAGDLRYTSMSLVELDTRVHGSAAVITARQNSLGAYQGHPTPEALRTTVTLVSDGGRWRMAGVHMSFIAGTAGGPPMPGPPSE